MNQLGKDGQPLCMARYIDWVKNGTSSLHFERFKRQKKPPKWVCPNCYNSFIGRGISEHRKKCKP